MSTSRGRAARVVRYTRRNARYVLAAGVVALFALALALFVRSEGGGGGGSPGAALGRPPRTGSATATLGQPMPSGSPSGTGSRLVSPTDPRTLPRLTLTPAAPGGFTYANLPSHRIQLRVSSPAPIPVVGYLIPTSPDHPYGRATTVGRAWSLQTIAVGKPAYAALFIQAGATGAGVTCQIVIDGRVAKTLTTSGAYGRQVCLA